MIRLLTWTMLGIIGMPTLALAQHVNYVHTPASPTWAPRAQPLAVPPPGTSGGPGRPVACYQTAPPAALARAALALTTPNVALTCRCTGRMDCACAAGTCACEACLGPRPERVPATPFYPAVYPPRVPAFVPSYEGTYDANPGTFFQAPARFYGGGRGARRGSGCRGGG